MASTFRPARVAVALVALAAIIVAGLCLLWIEGRRAKPVAQQKTRLVERMSVEIITPPPPPPPTNAAR